MRGAVSVWPLSNHDYCVVVQDRKARSWAD